MVSLGKKYMQRFLYYSVEKHGSVCILVSTSEISHCKNYICTISTTTPIVIIIMIIIIMIITTITNIIKMIIITE